MQTPIVFCADKNYGIYLPVVLQSIIENSGTGHEYHIFIFDCGMAAEDIAALERQIAPHKNFCLKFEDIDAWLNQRKETLPAKGRWTEAMYGRFLIPALCGSYERVIYADADIIFQRDIAKLMAVDLGNDYIAAVPDIGMILGRRFKDKAKHYAREILELADDVSYINSGLMIFNIKAWRQNKLAEKCVDFIGGHELAMPDQDAINTVCAGRIVYLGQEWNCQHFWRRQWNWENMLRTGSGGIAEMLGAWRRVNSARDCVYHYDEPEKPWGNPFSPQNRLWLHYAEKTEIYSRLLSVTAQS